MINYDKSIYSATYSQKKTYYSKRISLVFGATGYNHHVAEIKKLIL